MVSLTALVLTITMVVVQLAMGQFSPRIVQRFLQDKPSQLAIGLFVATFVHAILTLREVRIEPDGAGQVPGIGVITAFVLIIASIAVLVLYVHHIGQSLRVSALIELVGSDTRRLLDRRYPASADSWPDNGSTDRVVTARKSGVIVKIGYEELVEQARAADCELELVPSLGVFVPADAVLFRVHGDGTDLDRGRLHAALMIKLEPTLDEDVAYGVRLLVDIAERSLAESAFQDPTTAVQAIDRIHDVLRQLVRRPFPDGRYRDEAGVVRLVVPTMSWDAYVHLAFDEIRMAGAGSPRSPGGWQQRSGTCAPSRQRSARPSLTSSSTFSSSQPRRRCATSATFGLPSAQAPRAMMWRGHPGTMRRPLMVVDPATEKGARADARLRTDEVAWLITVSGDGTPVPTPVWFMWDGEAIVVYSQRDKPKLRHIEANPRVAFAMRTDELGDEITVITGDAVVDATIPSAAELPGYAEKYSALIARLGADPESFAAEYAIPIRITPAKLRQWSVDSG